MLKTLSGIIALLLLLSQPALAAPKQVELVYEATRNGQAFATVTETYREDKGRYQIESVTKGLGVYALMGKRILRSEGEVTSAGLKPSHFELHQGDSESRSLSADFDWAGGTLNMKVKGKPRTAALQKGAQDLASFSYQFMFAPPAATLNLPVTTGKKLKEYHYKVNARDVALKLAAGQFSTVHLVEANPEPDDDTKEFWLASDQQHLPVRIRLRDEKGVTIEQNLTSINIR